VSLVFFRKFFSLSLSILWLLIIFSCVVFAATYIDTTKTDFEAGAVKTNILATADGNLQIAASSNVYQLPSNFTSKVFGNAVDTNWQSFIWRQDVNYSQLPDNNCYGNQPDVNMCGNVLLLHMNETSGNIIDTSGYASNGTSINGSVTYGQGGTFGNSLLFSSGYITGSNVAHRNITSVTVSAWINSTKSQGSSGGIIASGSGSLRDFQVCFNGDRIEYYSAYQGEFYSDYFTYSLGWHFITVTYSNSTKTLNFYRDGVNVGTRSGLGLLGATSGTQYVVGQDFYGTYFAGRIDELALWNRVLSASEILSIYKRGVSSLKFQVRSCAQSNCSDGTFVGPNGTGSTYFTNPASVPFNLTSVSHNKYFQYRADFNTSDSNALKGITPVLFDVNVNYVALNMMPDINLFKVDGNGFGGWRSFSYVRDGNLTLDFNVLDGDSSQLFVDLNYSSSNLVGTGTSIVRDFNLTLANCVSTVWTSVVDCNYDWDISSVAGVVDGNYYILLKVSDRADSQSKVSVSNYLVDNARPVTSWDGNNNVWQRLDANIHLVCSDGSGSGCFLTQYRLDTDPSREVSFGGWRTYFGSVPVFGDGNFVIDFNSVDFVGNVEVTKEYVVLVGPHGKLTTYNSGGLPRSFFGAGELVDLRFDANLAPIPIIRIVDSLGVVVDNNQMSFLVSSEGINTFDYNFVLGGAGGWFDVQIGSQYFYKAFYKGVVWSSRFVDSAGNQFPFSIDLNLTERGVLRRWLEPVDVRIDFNFEAFPESVRVLDFNGTSYLEIPSQIYGASLGADGYVSAANIVFFASVDVNETRNFVVSYSPANNSIVYRSDLNTIRNGFVFDFNNSVFRATVDVNKGGALMRISNNGISQIDLNSAEQMFASPFVSAGVKSYSVAELTNPIFSIDANGPLVSILTVGGNVGPMDYNLKYVFYANNSFFFLDTTILSKQNGGSNWNVWDNYPYVASNLFNKLASFSQNTVSVRDVNSLNNIIAVADVNALGLYNQRTLNSFGEIFLSRNYSKENSVFMNFYDQAASSYLERRIYSGPITSADSFSLHTAVSLFNPWNNNSDFNNLFIQLSNPLSAQAQISMRDVSPNDLNEPVVKTGYSPIEANSRTDLNCFAQVTDNIMTDYVNVHILGPNLQVDYNQSVRSSSATVSYLIPAAQLLGGDVNCTFTAYDFAQNTDANHVLVTVVDLNAPKIYSLIQTPDTNALLDPGVKVIIDLNVVDYSRIDTNILYTSYLDENSNWADWQANEMNCIKLSDYNSECTANFTTTPVTNSDWKYKISLKDSQENDYNTQEYFINSYWDKTWEIDKNNFGTIVADFGVPVTIGTFTVKNTGDLGIDFKITSNWLDKYAITYNNYTEADAGREFYLDGNSDANEVFEVKLVSQTVNNAYPLVITVSSVGEGVSSQSKFVSVDMVSSSGGPFLLIKFVDFNSSVVQSNTGIFSARVTNVGISDANNLSYSWSLPSGWNIISGDLNSTGAVLAKSSSVLKSISVSVGDSAVLGNQNVSFTAGCCEDVNKTQSKSGVVVVNAKSGIVVPPGEGGTGGAGGAGGEGGSGGGIFSNPEQEKAFFQTNDTFEIIRGRDSNFVVKVKNPFPDKKLKNLRVTVSGLLSKYLEIPNSFIGDLDSNQERSFVVNVIAPKYFDFGKHDLLFTITGVLSAKKDTNFTYENHVILIVHDLTKEEALTLLEDAALRVNALTDANVNVAEFLKQLRDANASVGIGEYETARDTINLIIKNTGFALIALNDINTLTSAIATSEEQGINTPKTSRLLILAKLAFARGEFENAAGVLKDALLTYSIETKGAFNAGFFVIQNSAGLTAATIIIIILAFFASLQAKRALLNRREKLLLAEEDLLLEMIKSLQKQCFLEKKIGMNEYQSALTQYETRLSEAVEKMINTQNELTNLTSFKSRVTKLTIEKSKLIESIKITQKQYFKEGLIETRVYDAKLKSLSKRLSQVEKDITYNEAMKTVHQHSSPIKPLWKIYYKIFK